MTNLRPNREPKPINDENTYKDYWDEDHVRMPCSQYYMSVSYDKFCLLRILFSINKEKERIQMDYYLFVVASSQKKM